jgi:hypothetical protein
MWTDCKLRGDLGNLWKELRADTMHPEKSESDVYAYSPGRVLVERLRDNVQSPVCVCPG